MKVPSSKFLAGALALVLGLFLAACGTNRLEPGGAYAPLPVVTTNALGQVSTNQVAPDLALFVADSAFDLADASFRAASNLEKQNRALLWKVNPEIKHGLDRVRPQAWAAEVEYTQARAAYRRNPTTTGLSAMEAATAKLQQYLAAAQAILPQPSTH